MGTRDAGTWAGLTLPIDLGPFGAPSCFLSTDIALVIPGAADATGTMNVSINVPTRPALQGAWLYYQGVALDAQENALGMVLSQARKVQICGWEAVARVYAPSTSAAQGAVELGVSPVVELQP